MQQKAGQATWREPKGRYINANDWPMNRVYVLQIADFITA